MNKTTATNPLIWSDFPDPDLIRVGEVYYMVSTSMHTMPGCPIMKSLDLVNWEMVNYVYDRFEDNDAHNLMDGQGIYGQGSWAASLRYHKGTFYVCFNCNDMDRFYIYQTQDIENGTWERTVIEEFLHDPALIFDEGKPYIIYGCGDIRIIELTKDLAGIKPGGINQLLLESKKENMALRCEGCHAYKINGQYYLLFIEWPEDGHQRRRQICYRSDKLLGSYQRKVILDDDMDYYNQGVAQGAIVDTTNGEWFAIMMQDHGAVGRIPILMPVKWTDGWPILGVKGKVPFKVEVPLTAVPTKPYVSSDEFDYQEDKLDLNWQWNHNPDNKLWSLKERPGYLRLKTGSLTNSVLLARNTITQRTEGPDCTASTLMNISNMKAGDYAGMIALQDKFAAVGVKAGQNSKNYLTLSVNVGNGGEKVVEEKLFKGSLIYLRINFDFVNNVDLARFYYSINGEEWFQVGNQVKLEWTMKHFMGCRIGLFNYAGLESGGYVDFDYFHYQKKI
jgi:beta-xylosidase